MTSPEKPKLELSYAGLDTECCIRFISGLKTDAVKVAPKEGDKLGFHFHGPTAASYARDIINVYLDKSNTLPREPLTTIGLIYGNSEAEVSPDDRSRKIEMLNRQTDFLKFLKDGDLFSAVTLNDDIANLGERKYLSWKWFENYRSGSVGVSPHNMALIRVEKADTKELENETETLKKEGKMFEEQIKRIFKTLGEKPKSEVFIQEERHGGSERKGYDKFKLYDVPMPVANWLPQISEDKANWTEPDYFSKKADLTKEAEKNVEAIAYFIMNNWKPSYPTLELEERRKERIKEAIEEFVEKGKKGILNGIGISGYVDSSYPHYDIVKIDFDEKRRQMHQEIKSKMSELRKRQKQVLSD